MKREREKEKIYKEEKKGRKKEGKSVDLIPYWLMKIEFQRESVFLVSKEEGRDGADVWD